VRCLGNLIHKSAARAPGVIGRGLTDFDLDVRVTLGIVFTDEMSSNFEMGRSSLGLGPETKNILPGDE
jgi:hypothetical protein